MSITKKVLFLDRSEVEIGSIKRGFGVNRITEGGAKLMSEMEKKWHVHYERGRDYSYAHRVPYGIRLEVEQASIETLGIANDMPWEKTVNYATILYDRQDKVYKCWYTVHLTTSGPLEWVGEGSRPAGSFVGYALSDDGYQWTRPSIGAWTWNGQPTNLLPDGPAETSVFIDETANEGRFKALAHGCDPLLDNNDKRKPQERSFVSMKCSDDGIYWRDAGPGRLNGFFDTQNIGGFDARLGKYVAYLRGRDNGRCIVRSEGDSFTTLCEPVTLLRPNAEDPLDADFYASAYCVYPEDPSIRLLFPTVYTHGNDIMHVRMAVSRDGRCFDWVTREPIILPKDEQGKEMRSMYALPELVNLGDRLALPVMTHDCYHQRVFHDWFYESLPFRSRYLWATWEMDRLAGFRADQQGELYTPPFTFEGDHLLINAKTNGLGYVRAEILLADPDPENNNDAPCPGLSLVEGDDLRGDIRWEKYSWLGVTNIERLKGRTVVVRFQLRDAKLYGYAIGNEQTDFKGGAST